MRAWGLAVLLVVGGCKDAVPPGGFGVDLTVKADGVANRTAIAKLAVSVSGAESLQKTIDGAPLQTGDVRVQYVPGVSSGTLDFAIDALDASGKLIASGDSGRVALVPGAAAMATVSLGAARADMGTGDSSMDVDASMAVDMSGPADLSLSPDLSSPPDLASPPDLVPPPDLVQCGGVGQPCCGGGTCAGQAVCVNNACAACGGAGQPCCSNTRCGTTLACTNNTCVACGQLNQPCCPNDNCYLGGAPYLACRSGSCVQAGGVGQPCLPYGGCVNSGDCCDAGTCVAAGSTCPYNGGLCMSGSCGSCGGMNQPCCQTGCTARAVGCDQNLICSGCGVPGLRGCGAPPITCETGYTFSGGTCGTNCGAAGQVCCVGTGAMLTFTGDQCNNGLLCSTQSGTCM